MCNTQNIVVTFVAFNIFCVAQCAPKICIVGGGVGGTSVAYFLRELFGANVEKLDIFEYHKIGGRIALESLGGCEYEAGGTILHPQNKYMTDFLDLLDLSKRQGKPSAFGLYDGKEFAFVEDSDWNMWNTIRLLWRYGYESMKLKQFIDTMLQYFGRIYTFQENKQTFNTVEDMLRAMNSDFAKYLHTTAKDGFKNSGFSDKIVNELILATLLVNYGQTTSVHEFVASVSVAGAMPGLWGVKGGNVQIPVKLQMITNTTVIKGRVSKIILQPYSESYQVSWTTAFGDMRNDTYDIVIIATPLAKNVKNSIEFVNIPHLGTFPEEMHQTVATFVIGDLNSSYFGLHTSRVNEIFSINGDLFFNSIGEIHPVDESKPSCKHRSAWKVFSREPLKREQLDMLFSDMRQVKSVQWLAYPKYSTVSSKKKFVLNKNLYYINAIEWAASAMEMSIIGAKNIALLAYNGWTGNSSKDRREKTVKNEL